MFCDRVMEMCKRFVLLSSLFFIFTIIAGCSGKNDAEYLAGIRCVLYGPKGLENDLYNDYLTAERCSEWIDEIQHKIVADEYEIPDGYLKNRDVESYLHAIDIWRENGLYSATSNPISKRSLRNHLGDILQTLDLDTARKWYSRMQDKPQEIRDRFNEDWRIETKERVQIYQQSLDALNSNSL